MSYYWMWDGSEIFSDVYKRQDHSTTFWTTVYIGYFFHHFKGGGDEFQSFYDFFCDDFIPVSYTHLDVYKRQEYRSWYVCSVQTSTKRIESFRN